MRREIDTEIDVGFSYQGEDFVYPMVPVTGCLQRGPANHMESSWCIIDLHVGLTAKDITAWLVELFEDADQPVPPWASDEAEQVLSEIEEAVEDMATTW